MKMNFTIAAACVATCLGMMANQVGAQDYPTKPVTIVVPQAAGGTNDIMARMLAHELAQRLGKSFIVDNRPGAGGNIGTQYAARSAPDGYTLLLTISSTQAINPSVYKQVPFDPIKDFEPIGLIGSVPNVLVANPAFPAGSIRELVALAKAKPNEYRYASAGNGTLNHLLGAMLNDMAGIKLEHVPYKGVAPAINDVLGNQVPLAFASLPSALSHIKAGKLKALGVSSEKRSFATPDIPAIGETVPGFNGDLWVGLFAVKGTPQPVLTKLVDSLDKILTEKEFQGKLTAQGAELRHGTPEQLTTLLKNDMEKWGKIVKASGATID